MAEPEDRPDEEASDAPEPPFWAAEMCDLFPDDDDETPRDTA